MFDIKNFKKDIFLTKRDNFDKMALDLFEYQWSRNEIYRSYCKLLHKTPSNVKRLENIPFLPIELFKSSKVKTGDWIEEKVYLSSGTTTKNRSKHFIKNNQNYLDIAKHTFENVFGKLNKFKLAAILPSYQEQGDSSLIAMIDYFLNYCKDGSGYYLNDSDRLRNFITTGKAHPTILFGVSYALLDFAEESSLSIPNTIVIETGGMKGRRSEITREQLHILIEKGIKPLKICSEYGMTELTSQAYSVGNKFHFPNWAKVMIRDINDPFEYCEDGKTGGINIIDLGNVDSCAFIETKDLGKSYKDGEFEVLGRFDNVDIRGCNLMIE